MLPYCIDKCEGENYLFHQLKSSFLFFLQEKLCYYQFSSVFNQREIK
jgi:hypothetical protein